MLYMNETTVLIDKRLSSQRYTIEQSIFDQDLYTEVSKFYKPFAIILTVKKCLAVRKE